jgi:Inner membrane protein YgaP-like, transmembrane domain
MAMSVNVGGFDRLARLIIGIVLIGYAIPIGFPSTGWNWVGWFGLIPLATALFGLCPLYSVLGITTHPAKAPRT